jgi:type II secretory pathway pseudopilin PulG
MSRTRRAVAGFTIVELLVSLGLMGLVMAGVVTYFQVQQEFSIQEDVGLQLEQALRVGMEAVAGALRGSGFGLKQGAVPPWLAATGVTSSPTFSGSPPMLSVAGCFNQAASTLTANAASGTTSLSISPSIGGGNLLLIDDTDLAWLTNLSQIDTDPVSTGNQGTTRAYSVGTPVCLVQVLTFSLQTAGGVPYLAVDYHDGNGNRPVVDDITGLTIQSVTAGVAYKITLAARSETRDPHTGRFWQRQLQSTVYMLNPNT